MKKLNYLLLGAAGLVLASCSNEELVSNGNGDGTANVTVSLSLPQMKTRAYSDGTTATNLQYAVYIVDKNDDSKLTLVDGQTVTDDVINLQKQVTFKLVTGRKYGFVFWAGNTNAPYTVTFSENGANLDIDYSKVSANNEDLDAFYTYQTLPVNGDTQIEAHLYRPFAQINVGANDFEEAEKSSYVPYTSHVKVKNIYSGLDLIDGNVYNKKDEVDFVQNVLPSKEESFPVPGHDYVAMIYPLVDKEQANVEVEFCTISLADEHACEHTVGSVPVKRNYRTNIYGQLFTSNVDVNVIIEPAYETPDYPSTVVEKFKMQAQLGGTIVLEDDITLDEPLSLNQNLVLDLNDHNITGTFANDYAFTVQEGATVTVKGEGIIATEDYGPFCVNGGTLYIENGTFDASKNHSEAIYISNNGGECYISGGTFKAQAWNGKYLVLNCYDKAYADGIANFYVSGGEFYNYNPGETYSEGSTPVSFLAEGYKSVVDKVEDEDTWYVVIPVNEALTEIDENGNVVCKVPALPEGATEEELEGMGAVALDENGTPVYIENTQAALRAAMQKYSEIYFAPGATISASAHQLIIPENGITIYGNGATMTTDFSVQTGGAQYSVFKPGSTVNVNIYDLNNAEVWGGSATPYTLNVNMKRCTMQGTGVSDSHALIMTRGNDADQAIVNLNIEDCHLKNIQVGIHSSYVGNISIKDCTFEGVGIPVNIAKKLGKKANIEVIGCTFDTCGIANKEENGAYDYAAPIRVVDNSDAAKSLKLLVQDCTIKNRKGAYDVLLMDYRMDDKTGLPKVWCEVDYTIVNSGKLVVRDK